MSEVTHLALQRTKRSLHSGTRLWCYSILETFDKRLFLSTICGKTDHILVKIFEMIM
jgi:hypothetical protein